MLYRAGLNSADELFEAVDIFAGDVDDQRVAVEKGGIGGVAFIDVNDRDSKALLF